MDSNKAHSSIQQSRVYQLGDEIYRRRELPRFKAVTSNIVGKALRTLEEICVEEMQGGKLFPSRMEKYSLLDHYLDYLRPVCEGEI